MVLATPALSYATDHIMSQAIYITASLLLIISQIWLVVVAYKRSGGLWAVLIFFFSLIAGLVFCITKKTGWLPWCLNVIAWFGVIGHIRNWF
jgi:hypothetical protein